MNVLETKYNGILFRSRLEARWAIAFDRMGLRWNYEPEGFDLGKLGKYLPDFFFPEQRDCERMWVEIKPEIEEGSAEPPEGSWEKIAGVVRRTNADGFILCGSPSRLYGTEHPEAPGYVGFAALWAGEECGGACWDWPYEWCQCPDCGALGIQFEGRAERNRHRPGCTIDPQKTRCVGSETFQLVLSYEAARTARFDRGELWPGKANLGRIE